MKPGDRIIIAGRDTHVERRYIGHSSDGKYIAYEYGDPNSICASTVVAHRVSAAPIKREGWVNIFRENSLDNDRRWAHAVYPTEAAAHSVGKRFDYVATVKIEWEEKP